MQINDRAIDIINAADLFYSSIEGLDLNLVLIDVVIWETPEAEPIEATTDAGDLMSSFLAWRYRSLGDLLSHDNGVLITGAELDGSTIGLAPMGTLCRETLSGNFAIICDFVIGTREILFKYLENFKFLVGL